MKVNKKAHRAKRLVFACALIAWSLCALSAQGNPFVGNAEEKPLAAVRGSKTPQTLSAWQNELRNKMGDVIAAWEGNKDSTVLASILFAACMYGVAHALGPGHRKMIVFSFYLARKAPAAEPLLVGLGLSALHASSSILLMCILYGASQALSTSSNRIAILTEGITYSLLVVFSFLLLIHAILQARKKNNHYQSGDTREEKVLSIPALLITGIYPCPGALLILALAMSLNSITIGILAVASMSIGMSIPIIGAGYLAWAGRSALMRSVDFNKKRVLVLSRAVEIIGYVLLCALSLFIALPFIIGLLT